LLCHERIGSYAAAEAITLSVTLHAINAWAILQHLPKTPQGTKMPGKNGEEEG
jgi:hypothetical protein